MIILKWKKTKHIPDVPSRDLTESDLIRINLTKEELIKTGVYEAAIEIIEDLEASNGEEE